MAGFVKPNLSLNRDSFSRQTINNTKCKTFWFAIYCHLLGSH
jgi:hypothetical protein